MGAQLNSQRNSQIGHRIFSEKADTQVALIHSMQSNYIPHKDGIKESKNRMSWRMLAQHF